MAQRTTLISPVQEFFDPSKGRTLAGGTLYIGAENSDPKNDPLDRYNVYNVNDDGSEILISQPIPLNGAGQPSSSSLSGNARQIRVELPDGVTRYCVQAFSNKNILALYQGSVAMPTDNHALMQNRMAVGAHDDIYIRTVTLAEAQAEDAPVGTRYILTDLDNSNYTVVLPGDAGGLYKTGLASGRKLKLIHPAATSALEVNMASLGLVGGGDIHPIAQTVVDYLHSKGGGKIVFDFNDYIASGQINLKQGVSVLGQGIGRTKIAATSAMTASQSIFYCAEPFTDVNDISLLCNSDGVNGAGTGVHTLGSDHDVSRTYVSNSTQAGIRLEDPVRVIAGWCRLESCGRDGYTDNHGVMIYTVSGANIYDVEVSNCNISGTFRKGITTAIGGAVLGTINGLRVYQNTVFGSGLGDIYVGGKNHYNIDISWNVCYGSPIGIQAQVKNSKVNFNSVRDTTNDFGLGFYDLEDVEIIGNTTQNTWTSGIKLFSPAGEVNTDVLIALNKVKNANRGNSGAADIELFNTFDSVISTNTTKEQALIAKATYGIYEHTDCDRNNYLHNRISGAVVDSYFISGSSSTIEYADSSEKHKSISLMNGSNNNVNVTLGAGSVTITDPTAPYSITGITGGRLGRTLKLVNSTAFELTLVINSGASAVGNRLYLTGSVNKVIPAWGAVELTYLEVQGGLFWMDV